MIFTLCPFWPFLMYLFMLGMYASSSVPCLSCPAAGFRAKLHAETARRPATRDPSEPGTPIVLGLPGSPSMKDWSPGRRRLACETARLLTSMSQTMRGVRLPNPYTPDALRRDLSSVNFSSRSALRFNNAWRFACK